MAIVGRDPLQAVHLFEDHDTAYDLWKSAKVKGRTLVHFDGHLDFNWLMHRSIDDLRGPRRKLIHIGNFIAPAVQEGIVNRFFWVVPDPLWNNARQRQLVIQDLTALARKNPTAATRPVESGSLVKMALWSCPLVVCRLKDLPHQMDPVLLDIDIDYFVTRRFDTPPPYYEARLPEPWLSFRSFWRRLKAARIPASLATICYSVNQGYTPLKDKYLGDLLKQALIAPHLPIRNQPLSTSAAAAYVRVCRALNRRDERQARQAWAEMIKRDPSYRTLYATRAYREESFQFGNSALALRLYDQLLRLDPAWHAAYFGKGRVLVQLKRWAEAETYFRMALERAPGPSFADYWLGVCAKEQGKTAEAVACWKRAARHFPDQPLLRQALESATARKMPLKSRRNLAMSVNPMNTRYERRVGIVTRKIMDEVILVPVTPRIDNEAALFTLDTVGAFLWDRLASPLTGRQLSDALQSVYDVSSSQADADVRTFIAQLVEAGVLQEKAPEAAHAG